MNKKQNNDVTNDVMDEVAQQKYNNNKCYASFFKYIKICFKKLIEYK